MFLLPKNAALELIKEAISKAGYTDEVVIGMDVAASEFYIEGKYDLDFKSPNDPNRYITPDQLADLYKSFVKDYPGNLLAHTPFFTHASRVRKVKMVKALYNMGQNAVVFNHCIVNNKKLI